MRTALRPRKDDQAHGLLGSTKKRVRKVISHPSTYSLSQSTGECAEKKDAGNEQAGRGIGEKRSRESLGAQEGKKDPKKDRGAAKDRQRRKLTGPGCGAAAKAVRTEAGHQHLAEDHSLTALGQRAAGPRAIAGLKEGRYWANPELAGHVRCRQTRRQRPTRTEPKCPPCRGPGRKSLLVLS